MGRQNDQFERYMLPVIKVLANSMRKPIEYFVENNQRIIEAIDNLGSFANIAKTAEIDAKRAYKWYNETFLRQNSNKMTVDDRRLIETEIRQQIMLGGSIARDFEQMLKGKLSQEYYRSEFSICFHNVLRKITEEKENMAGSNISWTYNVFLVL